jgi:hypothetical protein
MLSTLESKVALAVEVDWTCCVAEDCINLARLLALLS